MERCRHCNGEITTYYDSRYGGRRGRCARCGINFPLE